METAYFLILAFVVLFAVFRVVLALLGSQSHTRPSSSPGAMFADSSGIGGGDVGGHGGGCDGGGGGDCG